MKRKIDFETQRTIKSANSSKARSQPTLQTSKWKLDSFSRFGWNSPLNSYLVNKASKNESYDTCIFPNTELNSTKSQSTSRAAAIQTESPISYQEELLGENASLSYEVVQLRKELDELKSIVREMQVANSLNKMRTNEELIQQLQKENMILKKNITITSREKTGL